MVMIDSTEQIHGLCLELAELLRARSDRLVVAESCTGGWVAKVLTDLPGSSDWFDRGYVSYSNQAKQSMLGVSAETLAQFGAVSLQTVREMTQGALQQSGADLALAVSGIAGPGGGSQDKPVGTVCFSWQTTNRDPLLELCCFAGDREEVRLQTVEHALRQLIRLVENV
ncbi:MAG: nicotinamide-nucleotide amidohydrolase family protein [Candidatus Thiodiazotropha lotti]|uniref:Nicotinamide-nucleotide amidohydrolase family protein n=1 Tax=Candidatus Thiodiazotropha lotti TaxID=2792787 RepID=A0A9E4N0T5_9GAMM|nr:nicotinamide-nucleotide amidohydrolase family protein [Candidatus Thiodiazotropha lotti]MCG7923369.1 nicotinamide-nucleotide amidohydrolase family protein [Candidatus Thiodiazotropha lotti]MCG7938869.1 nicotinamide-nucleotide amidohydrolase family protein [Candidatus Thiodiazotropha lotti]MCG8004420.1 nicotinamide-nucleotide amidohydrolase family protein [Candidatus Thiodiazotropha lotti]MCG8009023.1 nicotinamide-nucleotide amidohydrolase family protein [Candidatus Thiodiazotropha lotti]